MGTRAPEEVILQAAFKVASYAPEGSLPDWDVVERTLAAIASATPHYTPIGIVSSFSLLLGAMAFASLNEVDGGSDEWSRLAAEEGEEEPEELKIYDPEVAKSYFLRRPSRLIRRGWRSPLLGLGRQSHYGRQLGRDHRTMRRSSRWTAQGPLS